MSEVFSVRADSSQSGAIVLWLAGDLDIASAPTLMAAVDDALVKVPHAVVLDGQALTSVDSSGLRAVLHAEHAASQNHVQFRMRDLQPAVRRLLDLTGLTALLGVEPS